MKAKVKLNQILKPLGLSYLAGLGLLLITVWFAFSQGEKFAVTSQAGKPIYIAFSDFVSLALLVIAMAFVVSALSLIVNMIPRIIVIAATVVLMISLTLLIGLSVSVLWLAAIIANIALYFGRARLYVLALGITLFLSQIYNASTRTGDVATFSWLVAIDVLFAAPIFYVIFKYIPKQNRITVGK